MELGRKIVLRTSEKKWWETAPRRVRHFTFFFRPIASSPKRHVFTPESGASGKQL